MLKANYRQIIIFFGLLFMALLPFQNCAKFDSELLQTASNSVLPSSNSDPDLWAGMTPESISTADEFMNIKNSGYYKIEQDIDLQGQSFLRTLSQVKIEGQGYSITNIGISCTDPKCFENTVAPATRVYGIGLNGSEISDLNLHVVSDVSLFPQSRSDAIILNALYPSYSKLNNVNLEWSLVGKLTRVAGDRRAFFEPVTSYGGKISKMNMNMDIDIQIDGDITLYIGQLSYLSNVNMINVTATTNGTISANSDFNLQLYLMRSLRDSVIENMNIDQKVSLLKNGFSVGTLVKGELDAGSASNISSSEFLQSANFAATLSSILDRVGLTSTNSSHIFTEIN